VETQTGTFFAPRVNIKDVHDADIKASFSDGILRHQPSKLVEKPIEHRSIELD
jgi:hypothetical protein